MDDAVIYHIPTDAFLVQRLNTSCIPRLTFVGEMGSVNI